MRSTRRSLPVFSAHDPRARLLNRDARIGALSAQYRGAQNCVRVRYADRYVDFDLGHFATVFGAKQLDQVTGFTRAAAAQPTAERRLVDAVRDLGPLAA